MLFKYKLFVCKKDMYVDKLGRKSSMMMLLETYIMPLSHRLTIFFNLTVMLKKEKNYLDSYWRV
jgi:hypothetical protein